MDCPTYSELSRALGIQPDLHPKEIPVIWDAAQTANQCVMEVGTGIGDTTLLLLAATLPPTRVYSVWGNSRANQAATFKAVNHGIGQLHINPIATSARFAYLMDNDLEIADQWHRPLNMVLFNTCSDYQAVFQALMPRLLKRASIAVLRSTSLNGKTEAIEFTRWLSEITRSEPVTTHTLSIFHWS